MTAEPKLRPGIVALIEKGLKTANTNPNVVYHSRVSAGQIRQLVRDLAEALTDVEHERRRLSVELFQRVNPGQPIPESLV